ncbi:hypothetical protein [Calidithermus chliarophilus]|nr:hypothetical protein [Calidithermus chliarophilus]
MRDTSEPKFDWLAFAIVFVGLALIAALAWGGVYYLRFGVAA